MSNQPNDPSNLRTSQTDFVDFRRIAEGQKNFPPRTERSREGAVVSTDNRTPAEIVAAEKFAWPGGYEMFAVTDDAAVLCYQCCENEARTIRESDPGDGWHVIGLDATCNTDAGIVCDHCYRVIQEEWEQS